VGAGTLRICDLELKPLAEESLGVRSMSLLVYAPGATILLDPGVSLAPRRYGLPPHPEEFKALLEARRRILQAAQEADIVVITHYHRDHFTPAYTSLFECSDREDFEGVYRGKKIYAKAIDGQTPFNQKKRAWRLFRELEGIAGSVAQVNEGVVEVGGLTIGFNPCVHGDPRLGYVLVTRVTSPEGCGMIYAPDVQGPVDDEAADLILRQGFELAIIGGPPLYLENVPSKKASEKVSAGIKNLVRIIQSKAGRVVVAHHMLRSTDWMEVLEAHGVKPRDVLTYASIAGVATTLLEANRKLLYESDPPPENYRELLAKYKGSKCSQLLRELGVE